MHELVRCTFMHLPDASTNQQEFSQEGKSNPDDEILADAMGLGKNLMTISLILARPGRGTAEIENKEKSILTSLQKQLECQVSEAKRREQESD
nr:putative SWI/SNF-related matrix-associated actin-dependent regulator of chromatin subfamily A member 3-like 3 [Tanacetum cinerariifolium]